MSSEISADHMLNGDITNTSRKNMDATRSSAPIPKQDLTSNSVSSESSDFTQMQSTTPAATSTFKALSAGSYAERIRPSVSLMDNGIPTKIGGNTDEESLGSSKSGSGNGAEAKSNSGKRTGKNKSGSNTTQHRSSAARAAGSLAETVIPNAGTTTTTSSDTGVTRQGKSETPAQQLEESEQGWQEVTAKPRNQGTNKADKKESSGGSGRQKQHGKKSLAGSTSDENVVSSQVNDKSNKGKSAPSRKEKDKIDKESRQQQAQGDEAIATEPTRKQQQQQKDKENTGPKSLGMKSASWRSSPLAAAFMTESAESQEEVLLPSTTTTTKPAETSPPGQPTSGEPIGPANDTTKTSNETIQSNTTPTTQIKAQPSDGSKNAIAPPDVKADSIPTIPAPAVPAVNIWQLRKEKMKSGSTKQPKTSSNGNGKSVFSSLTGAAAPPSGKGSSSSSKPAATGNKPDNAAGKRQASGSSPPELPSSGVNSARKQLLKAVFTSSPNAVAIPPTQGKHTRPTNNAAPVGTTTSSATLTDVTAWPDVAASAVKIANATGGENRKKEREDDDNAQAVVVNAKKAFVRITEKKKWTPIPPAELQEALDKAEKARKAASHASGEGGRQKRRNSGVIAGDDSIQVPSKSVTKKNNQGQNKAGAKSAQGTAVGAVVENAGKKGKGMPPVAGRPVTGNKTAQSSGSKERGNQVDPATPAQMLSVSTETTTLRQPHSVNERTSATDIGNQESTPAVPDQNLTAALGSNVPVESLLLAGGALSPKSKGQTVEKQKALGLQGNNSGRQLAPTTTVGGDSRNAYVQTRDGVRTGGPSGRGGRAGGGKGSRNGNAPSSRYSDSGIALSPRGQVKAGLLASPPVGYQGLPHESTMAAAVHAPGFVPFGNQAPYAYYPPAYYYGPSGQPGPGSASSDAGGYNHTTTQQGAQQSYMPYNMPFMPQQRPVTEIPGLDSLRYYILGQIEYYFSIHNLCMDQFLKEQMDSHGWVDIPMIASFNRIRQVTADESLVKEVAHLSQILEIRDNKMRLRDNWQVWVFPGARPSIFPEAENSAATRLEELAMHGVRVSDLSEETRERIVGDIQRDILRSKNTQTTAPPINTEVGTSVNSAEVADEVTAKTSPPASVASDTSSDKVDIILQL
ncbi:hypothetical protein QFC22_001930 [Naganishia vaughanmartiniae]|uniref:Uncharacterized protein n=1 Tax=Naganishia vaughanmartiniae TaxID=1424756 RepID=A0ACC2XHH7_9TREE|nr:hypothetical protein QFC22_001930 [Naganishia vaughanmartiniae]